MLRSSVISMSSFTRYILSIITVLKPASIILLNAFTHVQLSTQLKIPTEPPTDIVRLYDALTLFNDAF
jgi:hypothetical protein